jgi:hypothetical protein
MNELAYVMQAWLPLIVWQQIDAPEYTKGYITVSCLSVSLIVTALTIRYLHVQELGKQGRQQNGSEVNRDSVGIEEEVVGSKDGDDDSIRKL